MNSDDIGERFKEYERVSDLTLPRRLPLLIRVDGRSFHKLRLARPFDEEFANQMWHVASRLCKEVQGSVFAIAHSDEVTVVARDDQTLQSQPWVGKRLNKLVSLSAAIATEMFCRGPWSGQFDSRAFIVPDLTEVVNYAIWRQQDATRNSVNMAARTMFSHRELLGKNNKQLVEMLHQKGVEWAEYPIWARRGAVLTKGSADYCPPIFTEDREYLEKLWFKI